MHTARPLFWFLLGFSIVFSITFNCYANVPFPGNCIKYFAGCQPPQATTGVAYLGTSVTFNAPNSISIPTQIFPKGTSSTSCAFRVYWSYNDPGTPTRWSLASTATSNLVPGAIQEPWQQIPYADLVALGTNPALIGECTNECPDSDNDGTCDKCDSAPNDSTEGNREYLFGYYEHNGKVVAYQSGGSSNKDNGYNLTVTDFHMPGYILGTGGIDEETFIGAGGKYHALDNGELLFTTTCEEVTSGQSCNDVPCQHTPGNPDEIDPEDNWQPPEAATPEQKAEDDPYLDTPERDCDQYKSLCTNNCGGNANVTSYGCAEHSSGSKSVSCQCEDGGGFWTSPDYGTGWEDGGTTGGGTDPGEDDIIEGGDDPVTPIDDPGPDEGPGDEDGDGIIDHYTPIDDTNVSWAPIQTAVTGLSQKFPFNLVYSIKQLGESFLSSDNSAPIFHLSLFGHSFDVDLTPFNSVASFVRLLQKILMTLISAYAILRLFT